MNLVKYKLKKINFFIKSKIIKEKIIILLFICFIFLFLLTYNKKPKLKKNILFK